MKRFQSIFTIVPGLFISLYIYGFSLSNVLATSNTPGGVLAPPEGSIISCNLDIYYFNILNIPPFRGAGGQKQQSGNCFRGAGGLLNYDYQVDSCFYSLYSPFKVELLNPDSPFEGGQGDVKSKNPIRIGLLIQDSSSVEARNGAELAVNEANLKGGYKGSEFKLIVKSMEGPWGTGSKQAVNMIFNDEVVAIAGSHDGRNAHLVEQATTKSRITFLSARAGDPTLSQAFTPWFFNCVPNDNQQAEMLLKEIRRNNYQRITLVTDDDYDAKSAFRSFVDKSRKAAITAPVTIAIDKSDRDMSGTAGFISKRQTDCLILFTEPAAADKIICRLTEMKMSVQIYGPLCLLTESSPVYHYPEVMKNLLILSSGDWYIQDKSEFAIGYHRKFGSFPGATAAYAYDAMMIIINAVKSAGGDSEKVQKSLMNTDYSGVTGKIKFDDKGNRLQTISGAKL